MVCVSLYWISRFGHSAFMPIPEKYALYPMRLIQERNSVR